MSATLLNLVRRRMVTDIMRGCRVSRVTAGDLADYMEEAPNSLARFTALIQAGMPPDDVRKFMEIYGYQEPETYSQIDDEKG